MQAMKNMLATVPGIEIHLVISASMERLDMREAVECFSVLSPTSYVFSKVDETRRSGRIIDQMMDHKLPLSFITNGQEVPEDLIVATRKQILNLLVDPESFRKRGG
jgi:flagellar biosynthesis protein FlhF